MVDKYGAECKICNRPFTTYRWNPGAKMRYKKTEVCQTCSKAKNVCQTCLLDLEYGLPVQVRDQVLGLKQDLPQNEVNREYYNQCLDQEIKASDAAEAWGPHKTSAPNDILAKIARNSPYYKRNRAHVCSFWVKGECRRGEECPYRHEKPTDPDDPLSDQNMKDRYYGSNDPVADKLLKRVAEMPKPVPPEDKSITTVYVGNVSEKISEKDLRDHFYQFGEMRSLNIVPKQNCAFVTYTDREAAETAINRSFQKLVIQGQRMTIRWGRSQAKRSSDLAGGGAGPEKIPRLAPVPGLPMGTPNYFNLLSGPSAAAGSAATASAVASTSTAGSSSSSSLPIIPSLARGIHYPSQDPLRLGSSSSASIKLPSYNKD